MSRGHDRERRVKDWFADRDYVAFRAPASLGVADVVAIRPGDVVFCEVKSTHRGPWHGFGPADRARLAGAASIAGARATLAWWPPRGKLVFFDEPEWPEAKAA